MLVTGVRAPSQLVAPARCFSDHRALDIVSPCGEARGRNIAFRVRGVPGRIRRIDVKGVEEGRALEGRLTYTVLPNSGDSCADQVGFNADIVKND